MGNNGPYLTITKYMFSSFQSYLVQHNMHAWAIDMVQVMDCPKLESCIISEPAPIYPQKFPKFKHVYKKTCF